MSDVTQILSAIEQGNAQAMEQLLPLVYEELRQLAAQKVAEAAPGQTLQSTALVHAAAETSLSTKPTGVSRKLVAPTSSRCFVLRHGNLGRHVLNLRAGNAL